VQLIWDEFLKIIKEEAGSQIVETWFKAVSLATWDAPTHAVTLRAPNNFVRRWIQDHYIELIKTHLARLLHAPINQVFLICPAEEAPKIGTTGSSEPTIERPRTIIPASVLPSLNTHTSSYQSSPRPSYNNTTTHTLVKQNYRQTLPTPSNKTKEKTGNVINEHYRFDNFIAGPSNSLAHAAAYAICENIGRVYNPLFIYGGTGLGKTHLLHAIANEVKKRSSSLVTRYETCDSFVNEFINAIRFDRSQQFRNRYQKIDIILFDDIQFLSNKEQTQESFFHIFNILYEQQKQIVLSSDTFPKEIAGLQGRLKSRMEWGLVADIQTPDVETKIAILKKKSETHGIVLPDDVADFIASRVISNIRELEGALIRIGAFASLTNQPVNMELARRVLLNLQEPHDNKREGAILETIIKTVAKHYSVSINEIRSKTRQQDIAAARQIAFYMMKKMSFCSLQVIGSYIGGRDHSTVIHAINKVDLLLAKDQTLSQRLKVIEHEILSA